MQVAASSRARDGLSPLQKTLIGIVALYLFTIPVFWYLETQLGVPQSVASNTMTVVHILCFGAALLLPWLPLLGQRGMATSQRLDKMVITWIFICLIPRVQFELPWLLFLDEIRSGVQEGALWSYPGRPIFSAETLATSMATRSS